MTDRSTGLGAGVKAPATSLLDRSMLITIWRLSLPVVATRLLQVAVGWVDYYMVGGLGPASIAAVGLSRQLIMIIMVLILGVSTGCTVLVAHFTGQGAPREVSQVAKQSIMMGAVISLVISALGITFAPAALSLMGAEREVIAIGVPYMRVFFSGLIFMLLNFIGNSLLQGAGDTVTPLWIMLFVNIVHVLSNYAFINGVGPWPALGVTGAAVGTMFSRFLGMLAQFGVLYSGRFAVRLLPGTSYRPDWGMMRRILRLGMPSAVQGVLRNGASLIFVRFVAMTPAATAAVAAYSLGLQTESLSFMPALAFMVAATTLVGQSVGAGRMKEAERWGWTVTGVSVTLMSLVGLALFLFAAPLVRIFTDDLAVVELGTSYLRTMAFSEPFLALAITLSGALRGGGDANAPLYFTIATHWFLRLPMAYILIFVLGLGVPGAWYAMAFSTVVQGLLTLWRFHGGRWKSMKV